VYDARGFDFKNDCAIIMKSADGFIMRIAHYVIVGNKYYFYSNTESAERLPSVM